MRQEHSLFVICIGRRSNAGSCLILLQCLLMALHAYQYVSHIEVRLCISRIEPDGLFKGEQGLVVAVEERQDFSRIIIKDALIRLESSSSLVGVQGLGVAV